MESILQHITLNLALKNRTEQKQLAKLHVSKRLRRLSFIKVLHNAVKTANSLPAELITLLSIIIQRHLSWNRKWLRYQLGVFFPRCLFEFLFFAKCRLNVPVLVSLSSGFVNAPILTFIVEFQVCNYDIMIFIHNAFIYLCKFIYYFIFKQFFYLKFLNFEFVQVTQ